jgi:DNA-binding MarR family transcriptional regulator
MTDPDTQPADELRGALLDEFTAYVPGQQMHLLRHWPGGRMSLVHLNVLFALSNDGPLPMNGLAEMLDVSQASATGIVDRMEQRGLVARERDAEDRRVVRVVLTSEGEGLMENLVANRRDKLLALLNTLGEDDAAALLQGLRAMRRARETLHATPSTPNSTSEASR